MPWRVRTALEATAAASSAAVLLLSNVDRLLVVLRKLHRDARALRDESKRR